MHTNMNIYKEHENLAKALGKNEMMKFAGKWVGLEQLF